LNCAVASGSKIVAALVSGTLAACASLEAGVHDKSEWLLQASNAVDFSQTVTIARHPRCYYERNPLTSEIIGAHPSEAGVIRVWAAYSLAHAAITGWLDREADATGSRWWYAAKWTWRTVSLGESFYSVRENASLGLPMFGSSGACGPRSLPGGR
jgi:hypothetical protein